MGGSLGGGNLLRLELGAIVGRQDCRRAGQLEARAMRGNCRPLLLQAWHSGS